MTERGSDILADALYRAFDIRGDSEQIAFRTRHGGRQAFTGTDLRHEASRRAAVLRDWLGPDRRPLVLALPAGPEFILTLLATLLQGIPAVPVPVPRPGSHSDRFRHIAADSGAAAVICLPAHADTVRAALSVDGPAPCPVVTLPLDPASLPDPAPGAQTPGVAVIQYTSGSTRLPKGVQISAASILANARVVFHAWDMDRTVRFVNWLPHYHDMGLMGGILYPLLCGGFSAQMSPFDFIRRPALWPEVVDAERGTFSGGPAFAFAECLARVTPEDLSRLDLSCWRRAFCGAEPVPADLLTAFRAHFAPAGLKPQAVFACYGMAEMTLFASGCPGTVDTAVTDAETLAPCHIPDAMRDDIAIVSTDSRRRCHEGTEGEIWLRGASCGSGYVNLPEETRQTFDARLDGSGGWLRTGDLGRIRDGALFVTGRIKDVVICNGRNIAVPEIEWLACTASEALNPQAAAAFTPDPQAGNRIVLVIETRTGFPEVNVASLKAEVARGLQGEWGLALMDLVILPRGKLPRTSSGKVRRHAAAELWRNGAWSTASADARAKVS